MVNLLTLVLNKNWQPLKSVSWKKAFVLVYRGTAEILENYFHTVKSASQEWYIPSVIRLLSYCGFTKAHIKGVRFSKRAVAQRDGYTCQYCAKLLDKKTATIDHVIPRSLGGRSTFENTVVSCKNCNRAKGDKRLEESGFRLLNKPYKPDWTQSVDIVEAWRQYLPKGFKYE